MTNITKKAATKSNQSKSANIIALLRRNTGATIAQLARVSGWQRHSLHGFMSGTLRKKKGLEIKIAKEKNKDRRYRIDAGAQ